MAWLLGLAVRRWPAEVREDLGREWVAELHVLGQDDGVGASVRVWRQLWFAASLAAARPHSAGLGLLGWLRRPSPVRVHTVWLVFAPVFALLGTAMMMVPLTLLPAGSFTSILFAAFAIGNYGVQAVVAASFGTLLGRRFLRRVGQPGGVAGYIWVTLPLIGGLLLVDGLARASRQAWAGSWMTAVAVLCLAVVLPPLAAGIAVLARRRRVVAVFLAVLAAPALTLAIAFLLVLLAPRPASGVGAWWWLGHLGRLPLLTLGYMSIDTQAPIENMLPLLPSFLFTTTVLALAQSIRLARPLTTPAARRLPDARVVEPAGTTPVLERPDTIPAIAAGLWWHRIALAGAVYSVLAWAVTLTYLTPNIGVQNSWSGRFGPDGTPLPTVAAGWPQWDTQAGRVWMHELQLSGIVCAALCLLLAAAYLGRPLLPTLAASAVLLAVNMVVVREGATSVRLLPWLAAGGILLGMAVWWAATRKRPDGQHPHRSRRLVIAITVLAAFLVPGSFFPRFYIVAGVQAPPVLLAVAVGLPTIWTVLAAMGVLATSTRPRRGPSWLLPAGLALLPAIGGVLLYQDSLVRNDYQPSFGSFLARVVLPPLALPIAAWAIAAIRSRPAPPSLALRVTLTPLLLAAGLPVAVATFLIAMILSRLVLFPMEYGRAYDGTVYLPGAVAIGLLLGSIAAARLNPGPPPTPSPTPGSTSVTRISAQAHDRL
ncbi:hypothetical protein Rhe02_65320 [Rhizocola hellebori]|uniref:Uncharacterized protein n=1 Tax=Rhizocola hellebori TaxID=1392758 RepID=A0A8J3QF58_9ACTN|nr:hypothetical protein Rhe02_65320 [Rhizocola hellebori]